MKFFVVLALCLATVSAEKIFQRDVLLPAYGQPSSRIIGGKDATPGQFPYQAGLSLHVNALSRAWCGGSLISHNYVLTAAHCTDGIIAVDVYLGGVVRTKSELTFNVKAGSDIKIHPDWMPAIIKNDISLIKIPAIVYTSTIQPSVLPANNNANYVNTVGVASGWGRTSDASNSVSDVLKYADLTVVDNSVCTATYGSLSVNAGTICASTKNGQSTCNGDSGGPLVIKGSYNQIGLTSYGAKAGCDKGYPVAFTRIANFLTWINANTK